MKKRLIALLLAALMLAPTVGAYTNEQLNTADALNHLGLFLGTENGYELDNKLTRAQGITLLVRMMGQEKNAQSTSFRSPFIDVPTWASGYVNYAWNNSITNGISDTEFGPQNTMTDYMFLTLTLRALGHKDSGVNPEFTWDNPYALAKKVGLVNSTRADNDFTRGDAIMVFWNALSADDNALAEDLADRGVFTMDQLIKAIDIQRNGKKTNPGIPIIPGVTVGGGNDDDDDDRDDPVRPPVIPDEPDDPVVPPVTPDEPDDPVVPPVTPDEPDDPVVPPVTPDEPDDPVVPPVTPDEPDDPVVPPVTPDEPDDPVVPPVTPDEPDDPAEKPVEEYTYEEYNAMSGAEQQEFFARFGNMADFFSWLTEAKKEYDDKQNIIEIGGDGTIDLGDLVGGN